MMSCERYVSIISHYDVLPRQNMRRQQDFHYGTPRRVLICPSPNQVLRTGP